jgi:hypothetical protein
MSYVMAARWQPREAARIESILRGFAAAIAARAERRLALTFRCARPAAAC